MSTIVQSTGVAVGLHGERTVVTNQIEAAMIAAIEKAAADGITDPDLIRELILAARDLAVS